MVPSFLTAPLPLAGFHFLSGPADMIKLDGWVAKALGLAEREIPASAAITYAQKLDALADAYDKGWFASSVAWLIPGKNRKENEKALREAAAKLRAIAPSRVGTGGQSRPPVDTATPAPTPVDTTIEEIDGGGGSSAGAAVAALAALAALGGGGYYLWSRRSAAKTNPRRRRSR